MLRETTARSAPPMGEGPAPVGRPPRHRSSAPAGALTRLDVRIPLGRRFGLLARLVLERDGEADAEVDDAAVADRDVLTHDLGDPQVPHRLGRVSTALRAAASHDSELTPITSVTRYTLSAM